MTKGSNPSEEAEHCDRTCRGGRLFNTGAREEEKGEEDEQGGREGRDRHTPTPQREREFQDPSISSRELLQ